VSRCVADESRAAIMPANPRVRVLVVDDDPIIRSMLGALLTGEGYDVALAESGADALLELGTFLPQIVAYDLDIPQTAGPKLLYIVRLLFPEIAVVAFNSGIASGEFMPGAYADVFYTKEGHLAEELVRIIATLVRVGKDESAQGKPSRLYGERLLAHRRNRFFDEQGSLRMESEGCPNVQ
jgi:CheY-like chemotaxis protein